MLKKIYDRQPNLYSEYAYCFFISNIVHLS